MKVKSRILEILTSETVCAIRLFVSKDCPECQGDITKTCSRCVIHVREQAMDDVREADPDMANELLALAAMSCEICDGRGTVPQSFANGEPCTGVVISCDSEVAGVNIGDEILFNPAHDSRVRLGYPQQKFFDLAALFGTTPDTLVPLGQTSDGYEWGLPISEFDIVYFIDRMDRYILVENARPLADHVAKLANTLASISFQLRSNRETRSVKLPRSVSSISSMVSEESGAIMPDECDSSSCCTEMMQYQKCV